MKKTLNRILIIAAAVILAAVLIYFASEWISGRRAARVQQEAGALYHRSCVLNWLLPSASAEEAESAAEPEEKPEKEIQPDFQALYEQNPHVVGWLTAGENIDYPVVQYDNEYYLKYNFYGKKDSNGTLFLNAMNCMDPRDDIWMIHGHHMRSGAMFGKLERFSSPDYLAKYPLVIFRTIYDEADVYYTPVVAFNASMVPSDKTFFNLPRFLFEDDEPRPGTTPDPEAPRKSREFTDYLKEVRKLSLWKAKVDVTIEDKLLALVTCSYHQPDGRFTLLCRQLREDETPEMILELYQPAE